MIRSKVRVRDYVRILEIFALFHRLNHRYEELELCWPNVFVGTSLSSSFFLVRVCQAVKIVLVIPPQFSSALATI